MGQGTTAAVEGEDIQGLNCAHMELEEPRPRAGGSQGDPLHRGLGGSPEQANDSGEQEKQPQGQKPQPLHLHLRNASSLTSSWAPLTKDRRGAIGASVSRASQTPRAAAPSAAAPRVRSGAAGCGRLRWGSRRRGRGGGGRSSTGGRSSRCWILDPAKKQNEPLRFWHSGERSGILCAGFPSGGGRRLLRAVPIPIPFPSVQMHGRGSQLSPICREPPPTLLHNSRPTRSSHALAELQPEPRRTFTSPYP